jgi:hypothetical protein
VLDEEIDAAAGVLAEGQIEGDTADRTARRKGTIPRPMPAISPGSWRFPMGRTKPGKLRETQDEEDARGTAPVGEVTRALLIVYGVLKTVVV